ncbi:glycosyltransferase family 2 protein [Pontibacter sp. SGAir0037]|uniref:glycosyltransferase family 2 protein n=1 Tax=Pontibacter sp. SGAir0037 TaxID=2571030 RepID=UPI0010CCE864|nr:glycosyltransferase family 2 protein [Pontibacter sp. SGAir0037]QCR23211.1 glycosyltransferase [Pontibacter sp. SGAir0037]
MQYPYDISVVVPLFNEEESLPELVRWIRRVMHAHSFSYEIILIDDGSTDRSWEVIADLSEEDKSIKGVSFNRNYGKSAALHVGFQRCVGEVVITMDADLQDSPEEIPALYDMIKHQKYDLVSGWKQKRFDPISKTVPSKLFNAATRKLSGIELHDFNCGLKAYRQLVVKTIEVHGEMHRYIPVLAKWNGFSRIGEKVVQHQERKYGTTKFGLERFIYGFLDLLSITFVSRFKKRPMHFFGTMGTLSFIVGLGITIWLIMQKVFRLYPDGRARDVVDQPLFFLALVAVIVGVQLFLAGFLAEMISLGSRNKNEYLIRERIGAFQK